MPHRADPDRWLMGPWCSAPPTSARGTRHRRTPATGPCAPYPPATRRGRVAAVGVVGVALLVGAGVATVHATTGPHTVEVTQARLRFDLPHGWHDADRRPDPTQASVIEAAQRQGFTPEAALSLPRAPWCTSWRTVRSWPSPSGPRVPARRRRRTGWPSRSSGACAPADRAQNPMTCRMARPAASSSIAVLTSSRVILEDTSTSTGSRPSRHHCAKTGMSRPGTADPR